MWTDKVGAEGLPEGGQRQSPGDRNIYGRTRRSPARNIAPVGNGRNRGDSA